MTNDSLFLTKVARELPSIERESYLLPVTMTRMLFNAEVRRHLLSDVWELGKKLVRIRSIQAQVDAGVNPLTLLEAFDELAHAGNGSRSFPTFETTYAFFPLLPAKRKSTNSTAVRYASIGIPKRSK